MATTDELLDALMRDCRKPTDLIGRNGLLQMLCKKFQKRVIPSETGKYRDLGEVLVYSHKE